MRPLQFWNWGLFVITPVVNVSVLCTAYTEVLRYLMQLVLLHYPNRG